MSSLNHRFDLLDVHASAASAQAFSDNLAHLFCLNSASPLGLANMLRGAGWQLEMSPDGAFHIYGYADLEGSRVREALRRIDSAASLLSGRLLYQDIRGLLLDYRFGPEPCLERLGRREYDGMVARYCARPLQIHPADPQRTHSLTFASTTA